MEERDAPGGAPLERIRPRVDGGAFRRPPVLPVVSVFMLFVGLLIGSRLAPAPGPTPTLSSATLVAVATLPQPAVTPGEAPWPVAGPAYQEVAFTVCDDGLGALPTGRADGTCQLVAYRQIGDAPPSAAIPIEQALAAVKAQTAVDVSGLLSARLTDTSAYEVGSQGHWVWELTFRGGAACSFSYDGGGAIVSTSSCQTDSIVVLVDAIRGEVLSSISTASR